MRSMRQPLFDVIATRLETLQNSLQMATCSLQAKFYRLYVITYLVAVYLHM